MALLWAHRDRQNNVYQVRTAGNCLRLYTNGVFHSQYNSRQPVNGSVWDLLLLPAFLRPASEVERILVLGVGGGAVIRHLNRFLQPELVVGVELNPVHLQIARRFFRAQARNVALINADAKLWLEEYRGPGFDLIIDDLFGDCDGEPTRAIAADASWCVRLVGLLRPRGVLAMNFEGHADMMASALVAHPPLREVFASGLSLTTSHYENRIGVFCRQPAELQAFEAQLEAIPELDRWRPGCRLKFSLETLYSSVPRHSFHNV